MPRVPITVVTGFLGAGKSTLVDAWLAQLPAGETAVIVNEQGEVGIDGALLAGRAARLREITGGCLCCTTQAELDRALDELAGDGPARILVETSGAASPAGVIRAINRGLARDRVRLDGVVTVVDATRIERALSFDLAVEQLAFADVVVLAHADAADERALADARDRVGALAPGAVLARARRGVVEGAEAPALLTLLDRRARALRILPSDEPRGHRPIESVALTLDGALDEARFGDWVEAALGAIEARVLRVKGILAMEGVDARVILQGVGDAIEVTVGAPWGDAAPTSRLVVLGLGLDAAALEAGFAACAASAQPR